MPQEPQRTQRLWFHIKSQHYSKPVSCNACVLVWPFEANTFFVVLRPFFNQFPVNTEVVIINVPGHIVCDLPTIIYSA